MRRPKNERQLIDRTGLSRRNRGENLHRPRREGGPDMNAGLSAFPPKRLHPRNGDTESVLEARGVSSSRSPGLSRACLQQLARHRHISLSVKSTRWALDKHGEYYVPLELEEPDAEDWKYALDGVIADTKTLKAAYGNDVAKVPPPGVRHDGPDSDRQPPRASPHLQAPHRAHGDAGISAPCQGVGRLLAGG